MTRVPKTRRKFVTRAAGRQNPGKRQKQRSNRRKSYMCEQALMAADDHNSQYDQIELDESPLARAHGRCQTLTKPVDARPQTMTDPRRPGPPPLETYPSFEERAYGHGSQPQRPPPLTAPPRHDGGPPRRWRKKRSGLGTILFLLLLGVIAVGAAAAVFLISNPPTELIRAQLIDQVKARTGRTLSIAGPTKFTVFPSIGLSMKDVTLSPPPGMSGAAFAKMAGLDVSVRLLPLLKREVSIDRLVLQQPVIDLRVDKSGAKSWDFAHLTHAAPLIRFAQTNGTASDAPGGLPTDAQDFLKNSSRGRNQQPSTQKLTQLRQLQLADVRIINGTVRYHDARSGAKQHLGAVNVRLGLDNITAPLDAKGSVVWRKEEIDFTAKLTSVDHVLRTKPADLILKMASGPVSGRYDGSIHIADLIAAKGAVALNSPSLRRLAKWVGSTLPPARGYGPLQLSGLLESKGTTHRLTSAKLDLDNQLAKGSVSVKTGGVRPYVTAKLTLSQLDLNNYLGNGPSAAPAPRAAPAKAPAAPKAKPNSIEDLLGPTGARVKGYTQRSGWSRDPINAAALGAVDANADLTIGRLFVNNLKIGQSDLNVNLKNKVLKTTLKDLDLYGGRGKGVVTANGSSGKSIAIGANLALTGIDARPLLKDAADQDWLAGKGNVSLAVTGNGASQAQIMNTLNGNANIKFNDGSIVGINIPKLIRGVSQGNFTGLSGSSAEQTDFSSLTSSWAIQNGVARNQDLQLISPLMRVTGQGSVMLGAQQIDYLLRPKLVANLEGQGGADAGSGLEIPVRLKGPWAKPSIQPEIGDILANPGKAIDAVKNLGKQFKGKNAGELLDGLLGGGSSGGDKKANPAGDLLDRFLR